jgi:hypothetical protein
MDSADRYPVYLGFWVNHSRGPVFGGTLTINREEGNILIAVISFYVAWGRPSVEKHPVQTAGS